MKAFFCIKLLIFLVSAESWDAGGLLPAAATNAIMIIISRAIKNEIRRILFFLFSLPVLGRGDEISKISGVISSEVIGTGSLPSVIA